MLRLYRIEMASLAHESKCALDKKLTDMSFRDFPLRYEMSGGSPYISLSKGWLSMKCHLLIEYF